MRVLSYSDRCAIAWESSSISLGLAADNLQGAVMDIERNQQSAVGQVRDVRHHDG